MDISKKLKELLKDKRYEGKTKNEITAEIGIAPSVLSKLCCGKSKAPSADTIFAIAKYFNVSADWLLGLNDSPIPCKILTEGCKKTDTEKLYDCIVELYGYASDVNPEEIVSHIAEDGLNTWTRAWKNGFIKVAGEALGITRQLIKENNHGSESD